MSPKLMSDCSNALFPQRSNGSIPGSLAEREHTAEVIKDVLSHFAKNSIYTLADSRHAPARIQRERKALKAAKSVSEKSILKENSNQTPFTQPSNRSQSKRNTPSKTQNSHLSSSTSTSPSLGSEKEKNMTQYWDIENTAAFMAAVRSRRLASTASTPASTPSKRVDDSTYSSVSEVVNDSPAVKSAATPILKPKDDDSYIEPISITLNSSNSESSHQKKRQGSSSGEGLVKSKWADPKTASGRPDTSSKDPVSAATTMGVMQAGGPDTTSDTKASETEMAPETKVATASAAVEEEDREHLTVFRSWGTPAPRDKPAAQVRRIIIRDLPPTWKTPSKVLSLIYGGAIESVSITPSGNSAHVLFCDAETCKTFYDKYPNGIVVSKDGRQVVFIEMGKEVDIVSSQLSVHLSNGATRVVRAVGVDLHISMDDLFKVASAGNRKVEKILDSYGPGESRIVHFRFCSIEDAVRFRGGLMRDENWEHCNIQFGPDPCEKSTGVHFD